MSLFCSIPKFRNFAIQLGVTVLGFDYVQVPLLGGAMCACTWHFFYNDPSLEVDF